MFVEYFPDRQLSHLLCLWEVNVLVVFLEYDLNIKLFWYWYICLQKQLQNLSAFFIYLFIYFILLFFGERWLSIWSLGESACRDRECETRREGGYSTSLTVSFGPSSYKRRRRRHMTSITSLFLNIRHLGFPDFTNISYNHRNWLKTNQVTKRLNFLRCAPYKRDFCPKSLPGF